MTRRLLIAVPMAAVVVAVLLWMMNELMPFGQRGYRIKPCDGCIVERWEQPSVPAPRERRPHPIIEGPDPPPPPSLPPRQEIERQAMPRERFPVPELNRRDLVWIESDPCGAYPILRTPIFPKDAQDGDYVVVEFTLAADGIPRDIKVVASSNSKIHADVIRTVQRRRYRPDCVNGELAEGESRQVRTRIEFRIEERSDDAGRQ